MGSSPLCTPLVGFLTENLGEQYGRIGELIRDELGIDTVKQAQTSLSDSDLVEVSGTARCAYHGQTAPQSDPLCPHDCVTAVQADAAA